MILLFVGAHEPAKQSRKMIRKARQGRWNKAGGKGYETTRSGGDEPLRSRRGEERGRCGRLFLLKNGQHNALTVELNCANRTRKRVADRSIFCPSCFFFHQTDAALKTFFTGLRRRSG